MNYFTFRFCTKSLQRPLCILHTWHVSNRWATFQVLSVLYKDRSRLCFAWGGVGGDTVAGCPDVVPLGPRHSWKQNDGQPGLECCQREKWLACHVSISALSMGPKASVKMKHGATGWAWEHLGLRCLELKPTFSLKKAPLHPADDLTPKNESGTRQQRLHSQVTVRHSTSLRPLDGGIVHTSLTLWGAQERRWRHTWGGQVCWVNKSQWTSISYK